MFFESLPVSVLRLILILERLYYIPIVYEIFKIIWYKSESLIYILYSNVIMDCIWKTFVIKKILQNNSCHHTDLSYKFWFLLSLKVISKYMYWVTCIFHMYFRAIWFIQYNKILISYHLQILWKHINLWGHPEPWIRNWRKVEAAQWQKKRYFLWNKHWGLFWERRVSKSHSLSCSSPECLYCSNTLHNTAENVDDLGNNAKPKSLLHSDTFVFHLGNTGLTNTVMRMYI